MSNESFNIQTTPNIGISIRSSYGSELPPREGAKQILDRAQAASEAQLDSLFLGDHHATRTPYYQNIPMMGRLLASWSGPEAGVLLLLPLWSPVLAAELIATLATLTSSRFVMQCGIGYGLRSRLQIGHE
ncbi:MAG: LLM class flavin-dependent oxidoreductase, partial [Pseudomonadales bacterium]